MRVHYHIPLHAVWLAEPSSQERTRLEPVILLAIERAVKSVAQPGSEITNTKIPLEESAPELFQSSRYQSETDTYGVPSYKDDGATTRVPVVKPSIASKPATPRLRWRHPSG